MLTAISSETSVKVLKFYLRSEEVRFLGILASLRRTAQVRLLDLEASLNSYKKDLKALDVTLCVEVWIGETLIARLNPFTIPQGTECYTSLYKAGRFEVIFHAIRGAK